MLEPDEQSALQQSTQAVQTLVAAHLAAASTPLAVVHFITNVQAGIDKVNRQAQANGVQLACQPACSHCCHAPVKVMAPEVFNTAREIQKLPPETVQDLLQRLRNYLQQPSTQASLWKDRPPCPFLHDNLCSIYPIRPAVCRRAHSLALEPCANSAPEIPQQLDIVLGAEALLHGAAAAYAGHGLDAGYYDFCWALFRVLSEAGLEERWLAGDAVFKS